MAFVCYSLPSLCTSFGKLDLAIMIKKIFHYTRRITPKRVTSLRCPSPHHSDKATQLFA